MEHRGTDPEAIKTAERLGLSFDGMQEAFYQFTVRRGVAESLGITFYTEDLSQVERRLHDKLREFGITGMSEEEKWETMMLSMKRAAKILGKTLSSSDMPEYLNWPLGRRMHDDLWAQVYAKDKKVGNPIKKECYDLASTYRNIYDYVANAKEHYEDGAYKVGNHSLGKATSGLKKLSPLRDIFIISDTEAACRNNLDNCALLAGRLLDEVFDTLLDQVTECECGQAKTIAEPWQKTIKPLYYIITDPGKTTFLTGDTISLDALNKENTRVIELGEMPATGTVKED